MGLHGLTAVLKRSSLPKVLCLRQGEAAEQPDKHLLVDAASVQAFLTDKLGSRGLGWDDPAFNATLYKEACMLLRGLQRAGLVPIIFVGGAPAPHEEAAWIDQHRRALEAEQFVPPTAEPVLLQVCAHGAS